MEEKGEEEKPQIGAGQSILENSNMVNRSSSLEDLPEELLFNILSRLPPKTLICLTSVGKLWLRIIRSTQFAHHHYATRSNLLGDSSDYLFAVDELNSAAPKILFIPYDTLELNVNDPFPLPIFECKRFSPLKGRDYGGISYDITGPCNGIFCLQIYLFGSWVSPILLWNPATRETRDVSIADNFQELGFGFDSKTCDYKVVCTRFGEDGYKDNELVEVYSLNSDSWKTLNASYFFDGSKIFCPQVDICSSNGRMFNWVGCHVGSCCPEYLITFDMSEEVFIQTPLPGVPYYVHYDFIKQLSDNTQAYILGGELSNNDNERRVDIWVLDSDYGPNASWTMLRKVVISTSCLLLDYILGFWKDEELVFEMDRKLFAHDPALEHGRQLGGIEADFLGGHQRRFSNSCVGYKQSLVSVKRRGEEGGQERIQNGCQTELYSLGRVNEQDHAKLFKFEIEIPCVSLVCNVCLEEKEEGKFPSDFLVCKACLDKEKF